MYGSEEASAKVVDDVLSKRLMLIHLCIRCSLALVLELVECYDEEHQQVETAVEKDNE